MIQLTQQQLITKVFHLFSDQSSGIGYINDSVYLGEQEYTLETAPDGTVIAVMRNVIASGGLEEDLDSPGQRYRPTPIIGGQAIVTCGYDDNEATAYVETSELLHLYHQLTGVEVMLIK